MKIESVAPYCGRLFPLAYKIWWPVFCLIVLTAVAFWSPSRALAQGQTEGAPLMLDFVLIGPKPIFTHGGTHTLKYQVSNYTGGLVGTITAMQVYVDDNPILTTFDNTTRSGYGSWNTSAVLRAYPKNPCHSERSEESRR
jgi:hypothetical protein